MLLEFLEVSLEGLATCERAALDDEILALSRMRSPFLVGDDFGAALAAKVDDFKLVAQISVHYRRVKAISLAAWATVRLLKPLSQTVLAEYLLAVVTLHVFLLHDVEADGTEKRIHKLLVCLHSVLLRQLVVASQSKHVVVRRLLDARNKVFCLLLRIFLKPCVVQKGALVVRGNYNDRSLLHHFSN